MGQISIDYCVTLKASNGVFVTEFDCQVECTVGRDYGDPDPRVKSIDAITVTHHSGLMPAVCDLLDLQSGLEPLGRLAADGLLQNERFTEKALEEYHELEAEARDIRFPDAAE